MYVLVFSQFFSPHMSYQNWFIVKFDSLILWSHRESNAGRLKLKAVTQTTKEGFDISHGSGEISVQTGHLYIVQACSLYAYCTQREWWMFLHRVKVNRIIVMTSVRSHIRHFVKCSQFLQEIVSKDLLSHHLPIFFAFPRFSTRWWLAILCVSVMHGQCFLCTITRMSRPLLPVVDHCWPVIGLRFWSEQIHIHWKESLQWRTWIFEYTM